VEVLERLLKGQIRSRFGSNVVAEPEVLVTLAKVGVRGDHNSIVAIGNTPNVACKLMKLIPDGGIVLGNHAQANLPHEWKNQTTKLSQPLPGYVIHGTTTPYPTWILTYRVFDPTQWLSLL
jgi:hypothetical protein